MSYPLPFHRINLSGALYSETFSTGLAVVGGSAGPADDALLTLLKDAVATWFGSTGGTGAQITTNAQLKELKVNRIGTDGRYMDPESFTWVYPTPVPGGTSLASAPQLTAAVTLRTAFDRGRASRGRMYLPPSFGFNIPGSDGRADAANAIARASSVAVLINAINAAYVTWAGPGDFNGRVAVTSDVGSGAWHWVTHVECGRVIDSMRSRRSSLEEDYQPSSVAIAGA